MPADAMADRSSTEVRLSAYDDRKSNRSARRRASWELSRLTSSTPSASRSLARFWIQPVASLSAGPPCGGLYLKPPSRGGLCDGVTTIPSASPFDLPLLARMIAWETAGVGV